MASEPGPRRLAAVAVLLAALLGVGAYVAAQPADSDTATQSLLPEGENISERIQSIEGVSATVETVVVHGNETNRTVRRIKSRPGTSIYRARTVAGEGPDLVVSNGSVRWAYDRAENTVTVTDLSGASARRFGQGVYIQQLFVRLNRTETTPNGDETTPGVSPLPVVPTADGTDGNVTYEVRYLGTRSIDGREAYGLELAPAGNGTVDFRQRLWVDTEWYFPLRYHVEAERDGEPYNLTTTYTNVTINPGFEPGTFEFEPPSDATVEHEEGPRFPSYPSRATLQENASVSVPDPTVPADFRFLLGRAGIVNGTRAVLLQYTNETVTLRVLKANRSLVDDGGTRESVQVGGRNGTLRRRGPVRTVVVRCDGWYYVASSDGTSRETLLRVSESIVCE
jgi:outer membrane lipoprotein-sorting protein